MMAELFLLISVFIGAGLSLATIWSRKKTGIRAVAVVMWIALLPAIVGVNMFSLSYPAPYTVAEFTEAGEYQVLGSKLVQDKAIYLWLDFNDGPPRYYALPWDNEMADRVADLKARQGRGDGEFKIIIPYRDSWDRSDPQFHELPQPHFMPDKGEPTEPKRYERST